MSLHATKHHECPTCRCTEPLEDYLNPIKIRPLKWYYEFAEHTAQAMGLLYRVAEKNGKFTAYLGGRKLGEPCDLVKEAKVFAQADFEAKMFSMIERT